MTMRPLAALGLLALLSLSACGGTDTDSATGSSSTASTTTSAGASSPSSSSTGSASSSGTCDYPADTSGTVARKVTPPPSTPNVSGTVTATVDTSIGTMKFSLDASSAPCTVNSFVSLAKQGYFDKTTCHRLTVITGFDVLQCGDPTATGTGGPGYTIPDELSGNETYPAGTLAMANTGQPNSGGSQFFIVYGDTTLAPSYTVFGTVDAATVAEIKKAAAAGTDNSNGQGDGKPNTPVDITSVTVG